jgi:HAD superfamily hydrolase (TIGR01509 family)
MIKALIFDFDGIIIDSETPELTAWQEAFAAHGRELALELWADVVGRPHTHFDFFAYFRQQVNPAVDMEQFRRSHRARVIGLTLQQPILPGVESYLRDASKLGLKIGVASSSTGSHVRGHLARLGLLDYFHTAICFEDTDEHKPDPAPYLEVLDRLGLSPHEALAIEDSPNGVASAKAAGIFCVAVPNPVTRLLPLDHADHRMESLAEERLAAVMSRALQHPGGVQGR